MYVQPNKLLPKTARVIKPYMCSFISLEGPNIMGKLNLSGVEIPYESQYTTRISLSPEVSDQPLMYGFLGNDVTFILIKVTYDETDPRVCIEEDLCIEYYMDDNPSVVRPINKLLLLTGNSQNKLPQIYLNNPSQIRVDIEVMVANVGASDISLEDIQDNTVSLTNLYHNSIISDANWNCTSLVSGSTQFQIVDYEGNVSLYLDYEEVDTIDIEASDNQLIINTKSDTVIYLEFLSQFEMYQGHSRMEWVLEDPLERYLSNINPGLDTASPVLTMQIGVYPITPSGNTYSYSPAVDPITSGFTVTPEDIKNYFIYEINDDRDGSISVDDMGIVIRKDGELLPLTGITEVGLYDIILTITDIANNQTLANYKFLVDDAAPVIYWEAGIGDSFTMDLTGDTQVTSSGITHDDIIRKTIDYVEDEVDGVIANSEVNVFVLDLSGVTEFDNVFLPGEYNVEYSVSDSSGNFAFYEKNMIVEGPVGMNSGDTYILGTATTETSFIYYGESGTTAEVIVSGYTSIISNSGGSFVWDLGGTQEHLFTYTGETISTTYNGTVFDIMWDGFGSLVFTVMVIGTAPNFTNMILMYQYQENGLGAFLDYDLIKMEDDYIIALDDNVDSVYNTKIESIIYNRETFDTTPVILESFQLDDAFGVDYTVTATGSTLYQYYVAKYPNFNTTLLDQILIGVESFGEIFMVENKFYMTDLLSSDDMESIVMYGNYPKGTYNYKIELLDETGAVNTMRFSIIVN